MAQILAFGDLITDGAYDEYGGWATRMQRYFMAENLKKDVVNDESNWFYNLGVSGNTAKDVLARVETEARARKIFRDDKKSIVIFAIGTNDSASDDKPDNFRFTQEQFRVNLQKLERMVHLSQTKIIFVGPMPVLERLTNPIYGNCWYKNEYIKMFDKVIGDVAREVGAEFIELYDDLQGKDIEDYFEDGLHPSTLGHE